MRVSNVYYVYILVYLSLPGLAPPFSIATLSIDVLISCAGPQGHPSSIRRHQLFLGSFQHSSLRVRRVRDRTSVSKATHIG